MERKTLYLLLGALALLLAGTGVAIVTLADWKKRAESNAGPTLFAQLMAWLNAAETRYGIPHDLLARQAYEESRFRPDIIDGTTQSLAGAVGIMQIVPKYHPTANPLNPQAAIDYAGNFLSTLHKQFGSWSLALAAYNAGPGNVSKYGNKVPPFAETQNYVARIIGDYNASNPPGGMLA